MEEFHRCIPPVPVRPCLPFVLESWLGGRAPLVDIDDLAPFADLAAEVARSGLVKCTFLMGWRYYGLTYGC